MIEGYTASQIGWMAAVFLLAYTVRGMSGFGAGLIAVPLLAFVLPLQTVLPVASLLVFVLFVFLTIRDRREVMWQEIRVLGPPTAIGVVAGLALFTSLDNRMLMKLLGAFLVCYAVYMVVVQYVGLPQLRISRRVAVVIGFFGAFFDTLFGGGGGTLVVIYMHSKGVTGMPFRATLAMLWFIEMVVRMAGFTVSGYYTPEVLLLVALMLPVMWAGTWIGERIGNRVSAETFSKIVSALLGASGLSLLAK